ncbi:MAG: hypothetical protein Q7K03_04420 [Dehalococcoidia bacterium]|nr:hypothetical protein [Dehalococcoidia bacterium]
MTATGAYPWPTKRTALLVIHGVGQQSPFDTLDDLGCGLLDALREGLPGATLDLYHGLKKVPRAEGPWVTNCLSIVPNGNRDKAIDCYEYYWAHATQRQITQQEVFDWIATTGVLARKYYDDNAALVATYEKEGLANTPFGRRYRFGGKARFDKYWYFKQIGGGMWLARAFWWLVGIVSGLRIPIPNLGILTAIRSALQSLAKLLERPMVDSVGDIAIYTATDMKSKNFDVRKKILDGATETLEWLMQLSEYDQVIVLGHSLGSVIAYDAVNRINNRVNAGLLPKQSAAKLRGLVTFGSPLDKIAYFFRTRVDESKYIKRQILDQHIGFRCKEWDPVSRGKASSGQMAPVVHSEVKDFFGDVVWINFWHPKDPIAGMLDFYELSKDRKTFEEKRAADPLAPEAKGYNEMMREQAKWGGPAHGSYWRSRMMYSAIFQDIMT